MKLEGFPQMADIAEIATAAEMALGWDKGSFAESYTRNRNESDEVAVESSPVGRCCAGSPIRASRAPRPSC